MASKAKKSFSAVLRLAKRSLAKAAEPKTIDSHISETGLDLGEPALAVKVSSVLVNCSDSHLLQKRNGHKGYSKAALATSDFLPTPVCLSPRTNLFSRDRMQTENYQKKQSEMMKKLAKSCIRKLGTETMVEVLSKCGKEAGEKEYNAMTEICILCASLEINNLKKKASKPKKSFSAALRLSMRNSAKAAERKTIDSQISETGLGSVKLGTERSETMLEMFSRMEREADEKEYNATQRND